MADMLVIRGTAETWDGALRIALYRVAEGWGKQWIRKIDGRWCVGR
jgi:hypothetical protein